MTTDSKSSNTNISGHVQADLKRLGKYEIVRKIGAGGMGTVYLAQDAHLNRTVALKVLPKDRAENPILVRRFQSEARASAMLTHDNIVAVYDADQADGYLYIALEYIDGIDLFEWLRKRERIPVKRSIAIIKQVAAALQHAHEKNLVHRDIKPANIMITKAGLVKLADMGLARSVDESLDTTITRDGTTVGTVDYMSPEQAAHSKNTDIRSDIYSLGCTWYHMLAGEPPFPLGSLTNKLAAHAKTPPPDPRDANPNVTEGIVAIIHRMMAKKKEDRYQSPAELLEDLNNSTNLESDSGNLLAMLLAEDELSDANDSVSEEENGYVATDGEADLEDSTEFEVQDESQSSLLKKTKGQPAAETNPQIPTPAKKASDKTLRKGEKTQKQKAKPALPPITERSASSPEIPKANHVRRPERVPLKRVQSAQELQESQASQKHRTKTNAPSEKQAEPQKQKVKASKKKIEKAAVANLKSKPLKKNAAKQQARDAQSEIPAQKKGLGIDIEWGRAGIVIVVVGLAVFAIWWGVSQFGDDDSVNIVNPYGDGTEAVESAAPTQPSSPDAKPAVDNETEEFRPEVIDAAEPTTSDTDDDRLQAPKWIVAGWARPRNPERDTFHVQRGAARKNAFRTLEAALAEVDSQTGMIDVSQLTHAELTDVNLRLEAELRITAEQAQTILTYQPATGSDRPAPWLTVRGGTLELDGLNFIITSPTEQPLEFLRLQGTDLILRNCTFTAIGEHAVSFIGIHGRSKNSNRIFIENSLFRGENICGLHVAKSPCDFYCENSLIASRDNELIQIEQSDEASQQVQIRNCTFTGGQAALAIDGVSPDGGGGNVSLGVSRSVFIARPSTRSALLVQGDEISPQQSQQKPNHVTLELLHTRFVNYQQLLSVHSEKDQIIGIGAPADWNRYWSTTLPSDDVITNSEVDSIIDSPTTLTAVALESRIGNLTKPGVGKRTLLGVNTEQVATIDHEAVERQFIMNRFREARSSIESARWSDKTAGGKTVRFDLNAGAKLNQFLASDECPDGTTVVCFGAGLRKISPVSLKDRELRLQFEQSPGVALNVISSDSAATSTLFSVEGGSLVIENGPFEITKSRSQEGGTMFLRTLGGANIQIVRSHISVPMGTSADNHLFLLESGVSSDSKSSIEFTDSILNSGGLLIRAAADHQNILIQNSVLYSHGNLISVSSEKQPGVLLLDQSTFAAGNAVIDCRGSRRPVGTFASGSVFASSQTAKQLNGSSMLSGRTRETLLQTLDWWESECAYATQLSTPIQVDGAGLAGTFENAWKRFWGPHHVYDALTDPQAVVFTKDIGNLENPTSVNFELQRTGLASTWRMNGLPIGARVENVGPMLAQNGTAKPNPPKTNTPSGF